MTMPAVKLLMTMTAVKLLMTMTAVKLLKGSETLVIIVNARYKAV